MAWWSKIRLICLGINTISHMGAIQVKLNLPYLNLSVMEEAAKDAFKISKQLVVKKTPEDLRIHEQVNRLQSCHIHCLR